MKGWVHTKDTACSEHKDIASLGVVDLIGGSVPLPIQTSLARSETLTLRFITRKSNKR